MTEQATMTLSAKETKLAKDLFHAYQTHQPLKESDYDGVVTDEDSAYRVQKKLTALKKTKRSVVIKFR